MREILTECAHRQRQRSDPLSRYQKLSGRLIQVRDPPITLRKGNLARLKVGQDEGEVKLMNTSRESDLKTREVDLALLGNRTGTLNKINRVIEWKCSHAKTDLATRYDVPK